MIFCASILFLFEIFIFVFIHQTGANGYNEPIAEISRFDNSECTVTLTIENNKECLITKVVPTFIKKTGASWNITSIYNTLDKTGHFRNIEKQNVDNPKNCYALCHEYKDCVIATFKKIPSLNEFDCELYGKYVKGEKPLQFSCNPEYTCMNLRPEESTNSVSFESHLLGGSCLIVTAVSSNKNICDYGTSNILCDENIKRTDPAGIYLEKSYIYLDKVYDKVSISFSSDLFKSVERVVEVTNDFEATQIKINGEFNLPDNVFVNSYDSCHDLCFIVDECYYFKYQDNECTLYTDGNEGTVRCSDLESVGNEERKITCGKMLRNISYYYLSGRDEEGQLENCFYVYAKEKKKAPSLSSNIVCNPQIDIKVKNVKGKIEMDCDVPTYFTKPVNVVWLQNSFKVNPNHAEISGKKLILEHFNTNSGIYECQLNISKTKRISGKKIKITSYNKGFTHLLYEPDYVGKTRLEISKEKPKPTAKPRKGQTTTQRKGPTNGIDFHFYQSKLVSIMMFSFYIFVYE